MSEESSAIVIELATEFIELMQRLAPEWSIAFFRFSLDPTKFGSVASYVSHPAVTIVDPFKHSGFFGGMNAKGVKLLRSLSKSQGVFLVVVDRDLTYDVKFDFDNLDRWRITKLNGGRGLPEGIDFQKS
jgi:hypothetical protein